MFSVGLLGVVVNLFSIVVVGSGKLVLCVEGLSLLYIFLCVVVEDLFIVEVLKMNKVWDFVAAYFEFAIMIRLDDESIEIFVVMG